MFIKVLFKAVQVIIVQVQAYLCTIKSFLKLEQAMFFLVLDVMDYNTELALQRALQTEGKTINNRDAIR